MASTKNQSIQALSGLNFSLADVRDGLGPFLGVFLLGHGWAPDQIGYVMTLGGIAGMLATTPAGAWIDVSKYKRLAIVLAATIVILGSLIIFYSPSFYLTAASQIGTGIVAAVIGPAIASLTLGIVGQQHLVRQLGTNEAWNHTGNMVTAVFAGGFGYFFGLSAVFILMTVMAVLSIFFVLRINALDIDHAVARGLESNSPDVAIPSVFEVLRTSRPLIILAITLMLFHMGNAAMLPLLGQYGVSNNAFNPSLYTGLTIVIAQLTMIPMALYAAKTAALRGYWILLVIALIALPIRGLIAGYWQHPFALVPVQILDGVGAGLLGVATPGLVAQILRGSGHINLGLGAVMTIQGIGAALSPSIAGIVATHFGYQAAFLTLGAIAGLGLLIWVLALDRQTIKPA